MSYPPIHITIEGITVVDPWDSLFATEDHPYVLHIKCPTCWRDTPLVADAAAFIINNQPPPAQDASVTLPCHCRARRLAIYKRIREAVR